MDESRSHCGFIFRSAQATASIASGVAAGFRSATRRVGELDDLHLLRVCRYLGEPQTIFASARGRTSSSSSFSTERLNSNFYVNTASHDDQVDLAAGRLQVSTHF